MTMKDDEVDRKIFKVSQSCARLRKEERRYKAWFDGLSEADMEILADEVLEWGSRLQRDRAVVSQERLELLVLLTDHFADSKDEKSDDKSESFEAADEYDSLSEGEKKDLEDLSEGESDTGVDSDHEDVWDWDHEDDSDSDPDDDTL